jgi:hypothetical protein
MAMRSATTGTTTTDRKLIHLVLKGVFPMSKSTRLGFKLIELVIVIAIVAAVAGLALPAVLKVRESQLRSQTNDNLRACAIAIHNYHGVYGKFPNAAWTGGIYKDNARRSMWFHLLPYVDGQSGVYKHNVHDAVMPVYLAPSDPSLVDPAGRINFAGNIRLFGYLTLGAAKADSVVDAEGMPSGTTLKADLAAGMSSGLTLARIPRGTSNVFMLATRYAECGTPVQTTHYSASPVGTLLTAGGDTPSVGVPAFPVQGAFFGAGAHNTPPDRTSPTAMCQLAPRFDRECRPDAAVFGHSFTGGGMSTALADASIRSVEPNMAPKTFCRALSPSWTQWDNDWIRDD